MTTELKLLMCVVIAATTAVCITIAWCVERKAKQAPEWPKPLPAKQWGTTEIVINHNALLDTPEAYADALKTVHAAIERAQESSKHSKVPK